MKDAASRIAVQSATNEDYERVLDVMGYEVRPHARFFRRLAKRRKDSNDTFSSVPCLRDASDAALYLVAGRTDGRFIEISQSATQWSARWMSYDNVTVGNASSVSLGAAMWAAYAKAKGL